MVKYQSSKTFKTHLLSSLQFPSLRANRKNLKGISWNTKMRILFLMIRASERWTIEWKYVYNFVQTSPIRYRSNVTADFGSKTPPADFCKKKLCYLESNNKCTVTENMLQWINFCRLIQTSVLLFVKWLEQNSSDMPECQIISS